jgi:hypothetical protein
MPQWHVRINGDDFDLSQLAASLSSDDLRIQKEDDGYVLTSNSLDNFDDPHGVKQAAESVISSLNGIMRLVLKASRPLSMSSCYLADTEGRKHHYLMAEAGSLVMRGCVGIVKISKEGEDTELTPPNPIHPPMVLARKDQRVARVLTMYGKAANPWKDLFPILEIIKDDVGGTRVIVEKGWTTKTELTRYRRTANHNQAAGDDARHGVSKEEPPSDPMTPAEARTFIDGLLSQWLASKTAP